MAKWLELNHGQRTLVNDDDYASLRMFHWSFDAGYATRKKKVNGKVVRIYLHRQLTNVVGDMEVDHINGDRLDNRRANLRVVSTSQNQMNRGKPRNNTSGYKGVTFHKKTGKWQAAIGLGGRVHYLGLYATAELAANAYDRVAREWHGTFGQFNFSKAGL